MRRRGFTLVETIVAAAVSAVLICGVFLILGALGRDQRRLAAIGATPRHEGVVEILGRDLANAQTMAASRDARRLELYGSGGIDPHSLSLTGRLTRVVYEVRGDGAAGLLVRRQEYLDDPIQREVWTELVARGVVGLSVTPTGADALTVPQEPQPPPSVDEDQPTGSPLRRASAARVPAQVRLRVDWAAGHATVTVLRLH